MATSLSFSKRASEVMGIRMGMPLNNQHRNKNMLMTVVLMM